MPLVIRLFSQRAAQASGGSIGNYARAAVTIWLESFHEAEHVERSVDHMQHGES
jgi:hypothetical protein